MLAATRSAPASRISRCSGARRLTTSIASRATARQISSPFCSNACRAMAERGAARAPPPAPPARRPPAPRRGDAPGRGVFVVLRLGDQVRGNALGARRGIRQHQDLGRPGDHVDTDVPHHLPLGLGHPAITRAHDLVHSGDRGGPEGERADRLGPTDLEKPGRHRTGRRRQAPRRSGTRRAERRLSSRSTPATTAGTAFMITERGVGRLATGHVQADPVDRRDPHAEDGAVGLGDAGIRCPAGARDMPATRSTAVLERLPHWAGSSVQRTLPTHRP